MNIDKWKQNFDDRFMRLDLIKIYIDNYMRKAIKLINPEKVDCDVIQEYVCGEGITTEKYKLLRSEILQGKFKIDTKSLDKKAVLNTFREKLMELLFQDNLEMLSKDKKLVEALMEQILTFDKTEVKLNWSADSNFIRNTDEWNVHDKIAITSDNFKDNSEIDFQFIIDVSDIEFMLESKDCSYDVNLESYVDGLHFDVFDFEGTKCIDMNFVYGKDKDIVWEQLTSDSYINCSVKSCNTKYLWEDFIAESFVLYKSGQYKLAFLQFFVGFDAFVESTIEILKEIISDRLFELTESNTSNLKKLIMNVYSKSDDESKESDDESKESDDESKENDDESKENDDESKENDDESTELCYLLKKYKRLCNDSRNLINAKFVDIIELHNYIYNKGKSGLFDGTSKYSMVKEKLNNHAKDRNDLAHGNSVLTNEEFQYRYLSLLSIFFEILMDFKDIDFRDFVIS